MVSPILQIPGLIKKAARGRRAARNCAERLFQFDAGDLECDRRARIPEAAVAAVVKEEFAAQLSALHLVEAHLRERNADFPPFRPVAADRDRLAERAFPILFGHGEVERARRRRFEPDVLSSQPTGWRTHL